MVRIDRRHAGASLANWHVYRFPRENGKGMSATGCRFRPVSFRRRIPICLHFHMASLPNRLDCLGAEVAYRVERTKSRNKGIGPLGVGQGLEFVELNLNTCGSKGLKIQVVAPHSTTQVHRRAHLLTYL